MDQIKQFLKTQIESLTNFIGSGHKLIIVDFTSFSKPEALTFLQSLLHSQLVGIEQDYYDQNKEKLEDLTNFEQQFLEVFYNDLMIKDFISTAIFSQEQMSRKQVLNNKQSTLEFFQYNQSTIKRSCICSDNDPLQLANDLKQFGVGNRPGVTFLSFQCTIDIDTKLDEKLNDLCTRIRKAQLSKLAPILQVTLKTQDLTNLFRNAKIAFSSLNQMLVENEVDQEYLILSTNIIDLTIDHYGNQDFKGDYQNKQHGEQLAYFVLKIFYQSLSPNFGGIFFQFDKTFIECKKVFNFICGLKQLDCLITCPFGVILQAKNFDEVAKSYSIVQRQQSATITINQTLKIFFDCFDGKYKNESEREILKPIQIGGLSSQN